MALARALATEPEALLLDEPFSALDTHLRSQVERQLVETLSTYPGVTLFVTHNLEEAYRVCDKLMVMSGGRPIALDSKHQIFEHPQTVRVAQLTGCKNSQHSQDYHVQAEMFKEKWELIKEYPFPWYVTLDPLRLILMTG